MSTQAELDKVISSEYEAGFTTLVESDTLPPGLNEDVIRVISAKKGEPEWLLEWRLDAYRSWLEMAEPNWAHVTYPPVDLNSISYYSAPKSMEDRPQSLDEVDPELLDTYRSWASRCTSRENARRGGRRRGVRLRLRGHHLQGQAGGGGHHLLFDFRSDPRAS